MKQVHCWQLRGIRVTYQTRHHHHHHHRCCLIFLYMSYLPPFKTLVSRDFLVGVAWVKYVFWTRLLKKKWLWTQTVNIISHPCVDVSALSFTKQGIRPACCQLGLLPLFCPCMVNTKGPAEKRGVGAVIKYTHTQRGGVVLPSGGGKLHIHLNLGGNGIFFFFLFAGSTFTL